MEKSENEDDDDEVSKVIREEVVIVKKEEIYKLDWFEVTARMNEMMDNKMSKFNEAVKKILHD